MSEKCILCGASNKGKSYQFYYGTKAGLPIVSRESNSYYNATVISQNYTILGYDYGFICNKCFMKQYWKDRLIFFSIFIGCIAAIAGGWYLIQKLPENLWFLFIPIGIVCLIIFGCACVAVGHLFKILFFPSEIGSECAIEKLKHKIMDKKIKVRNLVLVPTEFFTPRKYKSLKHY
jgi:hypothetical protein